MIFEFDNGKLFSVYNNEGIRREEILYVHFQKRKIYMFTDQFDHFMLTPPGHIISCKDTNGKALILPTVIHSLAFNSHYSKRRVNNALKKINDVKEAFVVYGVYDLVVKVEAKTAEELRNIITWNIRKQDKVRSTLTLMTATE